MSLLNLLGHADPSESKVFLLIWLNISDILTEVKALWKIVAELKVAG